MTIRTISQLPSASSKIEPASYFEVSEPKFGAEPDVPVGYVSKKQTFANIRDQINDELSGYIVERFDLSPIDGDVKVGALRRTVNDLSSGDVTIEGNKSFTYPPSVLSASYSGSGADKKLVTLGYVKNTIIPNISYNHIGEDSKFDTARGVTQFVNGDGMLLKWSIDAGKMESNEQTINHTGNLVMYGILADNGDVDARTAWVGLFGKVDGKEICISLQPWIIGQKSSILQYVGFNIPVKQNLKLKIRTGFPVNGSNSGSQGSNSMMFGIGVDSNFVGYVIY